ncbi:MAG TPA: flagellar protein FliT [Methylobacter sp.]|jgi:hypothetical protein
MPSKARSWSVYQYPELQLEELAALSNEIHEYVAEEQWEQLATVLSLRQQCLEMLFSKPSEAKSEALKYLANSILEQDAAYVAKILEQKKILEKQILTFDKSRQALKAYGSS